MNIRESTRYWNRFTRGGKILLYLLVIVTSTAPALPVITAQPQDQAASLFADAIFRVSGTDTQAMSFQWMFNGAALAGALTNSLNITNVQKANAGAYTVIVSDSSGSVTSRVATLTIVPFNALYCWGYSWTDTQGLFPDGSPDFAHSNPQFWQNRTANGPMWPEFLSTNLGLSYVPTNNYARGAAVSADVLNEVTSASIGSKPALNVYFLWAGDSDFLSAADSNYGGSVPYIPWTNETGWQAMIRSALNNNSNAVERLYAKGAREIVVQNLDDFSRHPAMFQDFGHDTNRFQAFRQRVQTFNSELDSALESIARTKPDLRLLVLDMYSKLNEVEDNFSSYGFTKIYPNALADQALQDKSFNGPGKDYAFWDGLHGTSKLNALISDWGFALLTNSVVETLAMSLDGSLPQIQMNRLQTGRDYQLETSTDLIQWHELERFTAQAGTNLWTGNGGIDATSMSFYRLTWQR